MIQIPAAQAVIELDKLLSEVAQGQEVIIIGADGSAFKLLALPRTPKPVFGSAQGLVHIGPDFDKPIEGFEEYLP
jgi:antitoxin (DNA-binding transcriptional repressor) of toxin-antitoxin stability system